MRYRLKNAQVLQDGMLHPADVLVSDGRIVSIGDRISCPTDTVSVDLHHSVLFPGFVDVHVHLREPGFSYKETIRSGTLAAAHGGFAHVAAMPNLDPVPDCRAALDVQRRLIGESAAVHVHPYGAITVGERGERLADLADMAPDVIAFSDDGKGVQSESLMREAMLECRRLGKILAAHCEDNSLLRGGYIHDGAYARAHGHRGICSESEWSQIARDVRLAEETGCAYHVCHVSTKESVEIIRAAKRRGVDVTCETAAHYLAFTDADLQEDGRFKMNPPLRSPEDRDALVEGLQDGTVDMVATDHAPHSAEEKALPLTQAPSGMVGLETSLALSLTGLYHAGFLTLSQVIEKMSAAPAAVLGLGETMGALAIGRRADLVLFDPDETWTIDPAQFASKGRNTPFGGCVVRGRVKYTISKGKIIYRQEG